jgi:hypothetical protein
LETGLLQKHAEAAFTESSTGATTRNSRENFELPSYFKRSFVHNQLLSLAAGFRKPNYPATANRDQSA